MVGHLDAEPNEEKSNGEEQTTRPGRMVALGIAIGSGLGTALGVALDNLALGIAIGTGAGIAIGAALEGQRGK